MELILLSGGSGKRLWPLSNDSRSKQFLRVLPGEQELESMVQRVWKQLQDSNLSDSTVIATSKSQVDMIQSQLGHEVPLIIEPERRDTFPAIALAAVYLYSVKNVDLNEVVAVLPVDPYVETSFFEKIKDLEAAIASVNADLALIGAAPTYPSSKYGYIVPTSEASLQEGIVEVKSFKEKPSESEAEQLIQEKALWNCGVFSFKLDYLISLLKEENIPVDYNTLLKQYNELEKISFDYAVVEKARNIIALPYYGTWKDLGTWNTLTEEMGNHVIGKGILCDESVNTHLVNELDIPVTVIGLDNAIVAASPDGILVSDKLSSPKIKEMLNGFEQRPMYEERRWGWYKVLEHTKFDKGNEVLTKRICVNAGSNLSYQKHYARSEVWTIIKGEGYFALDDKIVAVKPGDVLVIPVGSKHGIKAVTELEFIEVQTGSQLIEEDIVRIFMTWEEVEEHCNVATQ